MVTEEEIKKELDSIRDGMTLMDGIVHQDYKTGEGKLTEKQVEIARRLFKLFDRLNWQINFNSYKELRYDESRPPIDRPMGRKIGAPVKVRSCKEEHGKETYFGILIGDVPLGVSHSMEDGVVTAKRTFYNPAILIPELGEIVYGAESWWGEIESEEEMGKLITDETIKNAWYVKALAKITEEPGEKETV